LKEFYLEFCGPYKLIGEDNLLWESHLANQHGIYIWTIEFEEKFYIEYIGETGKSFTERTKEHMYKTLGGNYHVLDIEKVKAEGKPIYSWEGNGKEGFGHFMNLYLDKAPKILEYISALNIFLAPFESEKRERKLIEGNLAKYIYNQNETVNRFSQKGLRYIYNRKDEENQFVAYLSSTIPIVGLPSIIEI
jgi:hypothetical protein